MGDARPAYLAPLIRQLGGRSGQTIVRNNRIHHSAGRQDDQLIWTRIDVGTQGAWPLDFEVLGGTALEVSAGVVVQH